MHYRIIDRQRSLLVFDRPDDVDYCASCQIFVYGDVGLMYGVNGNKFYEMMALSGDQIMRDLKVETLQGYVTDAHVRLMQIVLRRIATIELAWRGMMAGHEMQWVVIRAKEPQPAPAIERRTSAKLEELLAQAAGEETLEFLSRGST